MSKEPSDSGDFFDPEAMTRFEEDFEREIEKGEDKMDRERDERLEQSFSPSFKELANIVHGEDREKFNQELDNIKNKDYGKSAMQLCSKEGK